MIYKWLGEHNYSLTSQHLEQIGIKGAIYTQGYIDKYNDELYKGVIIDFSGTLTEQQLQQIDAILPYCRREGHVVRDLLKEIDELKTRVSSLEKVKLS
jgi:hypothetical protein